MIFSVYWPLPSQRIFVFSAFVFGAQLLRAASGVRFNELEAEQLVQAGLAHSAEVSSLKTSRSATPGPSPVPVPVPEPPPSTDNQTVESTTAESDEGDEAVREAVDSQLTESHYVNPKSDPEEECDESAGCEGGDMMLPPESVRQSLLELAQSSGVNLSRRAVHLGDLWPNGQVCYKWKPGIDRNIRDIALAAMELWSAKTCIEFKEAPDCDNPDTAAIIGSSGKGCAAHSGYWNARSWDQSVNLSPKGCAHVGSALHELGHVIGLGHEHVREGRDQYVQINIGNIKSSATKWFDRTDERTKFGDAPARLPYDLSSIMHYDAWAWAKTKRYSDKSTSTISVKKKDVYGNCHVGQRSRLSIGDVLTVATMYKCPAKTVQWSKRPCKDTRYKGMTCAQAANRMFSSGSRAGLPYCQYSRVQDACPVACGACADVPFCPEDPHPAVQDFNALLTNLGLEEYAAIFDRDADKRDSPSGHGGGNYSSGRTSSAALSSHKRSTRISSRFTTASVSRRRRRDGSNESEDTGTDNDGRRRRRGGSNESERTGTDHDGRRRRKSETDTDDDGRRRRRGGSRRDDDPMP